MNVLIAGTRFACVAIPVHFRNLTRKQCYTICAIPWTVATVQSAIFNSFRW